MPAWHTVCLLLRNRFKTKSTKIALLQNSQVGGMFFAIQTTKLDEMKCYTLLGTMLVVTRKIKSK